MPVDWTPAADYDDQREEADRRIAARDPDDWPTVALALKLGLPVWSQDKDLTDAGVDVLTTGELLDALRHAMVYVGMRRGVCLATAGPPVDGSAPPRLSAGRMKSRLSPGTATDDGANRGRHAFESPVACHVAPGEVPCLAMTVRTEELQILESIVAPTAVDVESVLTPRASNRRLR